MSVQAFEHIRLMVRAILTSPGELSWSAQGLGMLRVYLAPHVRLHVWDRSLLVPGASPLHSHPWDFESLVVAGRVLNRRFTEDAAEACGPFNTWNRVKIQCGEDAHPVGDVEPVGLEEQADEFYVAGDGYRQQAEEIHWSLPEDGTVTLCTRAFLEDRDHASVYWRGRGQWVDAKPRPATTGEIVLVTRRALETWF